MNLSLYEISAQYRQAFFSLAESDYDDETIDATLQGLEGEIEAKSQSVAAFIRNLEASAESIKQAEKQMADRRKVIENKADRIREYLKTNMQACGINKIECPYFALTLKQNPPSVIIDDAGKIPGELYVYPEAPSPYPDKKAIAERLKAGEVIEGAHLERAVRLEIK